MPESRVFRPRSEEEDQLITKLMEVRAQQGVITTPSWTQYVSFLINRDVAEIRQGYREKVGRR